MGALSGAATGATIGSVIPGVGTLAGAAIGGFIGLGTSLISGLSQNYQDRLATEREKTSLTMQLAEANGLAALSKDQNTNQANRYAANQERLAAQTMSNAEFQMKLMGTQAQANQEAVNAQITDLTLSAEQAIGQAQAQSALSGLRNSGSLKNAEKVQSDTAQRKMSAVEKQAYYSRMITEGQLQSTKTTATQAVEALRYAGQEAITRANEQNQSIDAQLSFLQDKLNQDIEWTDEDTKWLNSWGLGVSIASSFI